MARRGSYFFVIDAFIAGIIVIAAIVVLFSRFLAQTPTEPAFYTAEDFLAFLESTQVRDFDSALVRNWTADGTIVDTQVTLLQQLALFHVTGQSTHATDLAAIVGQGIPGAVNYELFVEGVSYYDSSTEVSQPVSKDDAEVFFSSKRIVLLRKQPSDVYPPALIEVQTWQ